MCSFLSVSSIRHDYFESHLYPSMYESFIPFSFIALCGDTIVGLFIHLLIHLGWFLVLCVNAYTFISLG